MTKRRFVRTADDSVAQYHWLVGHGVPFKAVFYPDYSGEPPTDDGLVYSGSENAHPFNQIAKPAPRGHVPQIPGKAGGLLMEKLIAAVEKTPAKLMYDTRCEALVVDDDGSGGRCGDEDVRRRAQRPRAPRRGAHHRRLHHEPRHGA